jgi:adenylyltransferase/sulfurtransferase
VDSDTVELSNLQRQIMHGMSTIGKEKVLSAKRRLGDINPSVRVHAYNTRLYEENVEELLGEYPYIVDATDNFASRYIINQACVKMKKTFIYGAVFQFYGQLSVFQAGQGPCFQCVFRKMPSEDYIRANQGVGVVGALPGVIGSMQALEAIKMIVGIGTPAVGRLLLYDGLEANCQEIKIEKDPDCPIC